MRAFILRVLALALALTMLGALALADSPYGTVYLPQLEFVKTEFWGGQTLPVRCGPGNNYERLAGGYAKASTDDSVYVAGWEGDWLLVLYDKSEGQRVGYVSVEKISGGRRGLWDGAAKRKLSMAYEPGKITSACSLTDDPSSYYSDAIAYCPAGLSVTLLATYYNGLNWTYVETVVDGKPVRAFVPSGCVRAD